MTDIGERENLQTPASKRPLGGTVEHVGALGPPESRALARGPLRPSLAPTSSGSALAKNLSKKPTRNQAHVC